MWDNILNVLGRWSKKTPPIFLPLWLFIGIVTAFAIVLPMWLIGFWSCITCKRIFWMKYKRKRIVYDRSDWGLENPKSQCVTCHSKYSNK